MELVYCYCVIIALTYLETGSADTCYGVHPVILNICYFYLSYDQREACFVIGGNICCLATALVQ